MADYDHVLKTYDNKRKKKLMPSWHDFSFADFVGWHPRLSVSELEGTDLRFFMFGTDFVQLFAQELTGKLLCEAMEPDRTVDTKRHFDKLVNGPYIGWTKREVPIPDRSFKKFEVLDLPLANKNGVVAGFLHVLGASQN